jgi:transcriptional regulator with XRE-family HTH domain
MTEKTGKIVKHLLIDKGVSVKELAEKMGIQGDNKAQLLSNKIYRNSFSYAEMVQIAEILQCKIKIIADDTGKDYAE